jgi:hypothetical protein
VQQQQQMKKKDSNNSKTNKAAASSDKTKKSRNPHAPHREGPISVMKNGARALKDRVDRVVSRCTSGPSRRLLVHTILRQLPQEASHHGGKVVLGGADAARLCVIGFTNAMRAVVTDHGSFFERDSQALSAATLLRHQLQDLDSALELIPGGVQVSVLVPPDRTPDPRQRLTERVLSSLLGIKALIDGDQQPGWHQLRSCLSGRTTDYYLLGPGSGARSPNKSGDDDRLVAADVHVSVHEYKRALPGGDKMRHESVLKLGVGFIDRMADDEGDGMASGGRYEQQQQQLASGDMVTVRVPLAGDTRLTETFADMSGYVKPVKYISNESTVNAFTIHALLSELLQSSSSSSSAADVRIACGLSVILAVSDVVLAVDNMVKEIVGGGRRVASGHRRRSNPLLNPLFSSPGTATDEQQQQPALDVDVIKTSNVNKNNNNSTVNSNVNKITSETTRAEPVNETLSSNHVAPNVVEPPAHFNKRAAKKDDPIVAAVNGRFATLEASPLVRGQGSASVSGVIKRARVTATEWSKAVAKVMSKSATTRARLQQMAAAYVDGSSSTSSSSSALLEIW